jgi:hypothetical protein
MREVRKGDLVLNVCDGDLRGTSYAKTSYQERHDEPPQPGRWAGMAPFYRIDLEGFTQIDEPLPLSDLYERFGAQLKQELFRIRNNEGDYLRPPFDLGETEKLKLGQTYLTHCTTLLYQIIRDWARGTLPPTVNASALAQPVQPFHNGPRFWAISLGRRPDGPSAGQGGGQFVRLHQILRSQFAAGQSVSAASS